MIGARARWVLAQIATREDGDLAAARRASYAAIDPLVRGLVRGRVQGAVAAAAFETTRADDERHVHRLALLRLAGDLGGLPDDLDEVRERFEARAPRAAPARFGVTLTALGALLVIGGAAAGLGWWRSRPPAALHDDVAPSAGAWAEGGRPERGDEATEELFERLLPRFVAALDGLRAERGTPRQAERLIELERAEAALLGRSEQVLGAETTSFLRALVDQSKQMIEDDGAVAADSHMRSVDAFNQAIAARGLAYYVDADVLTESRTGRHRVYLSTFNVERVRHYVSGDRSVRALRLTRLDHLNFARSVLGFTRPQVSDGLVLLDRIENHMVQTLLPALDDGARMPLVDEESGGAPWAAQVEALAAADARAEARALVGEQSVQLGAIFARRQALLDAWAERLAPSGLRIARPRRFDFDVDGFHALEDRVPREEWRQLEAVARDSQAEEARVAYRALEETFVASVERHEVQHRLDYVSGAMAHIPPALEAKVGPLAIDGIENRRAQRALAELSAYLSELARGPAIVRTNLALFAQHALNRRGWGSPECYAALVVFEGLAEELGLGHSELVVARQIDRAALVDLYVALRERPSAELAGAARALWARLFARPLDALEAR